MILNSPNKVNITTLDSNFINQNRSSSPFKGFFKTHKFLKIGLVFLILGSFLAVSGYFALNLLKNQELDLAKASGIQSDLLETTFGDNGRVLIPETPNYLIQQNGFLEVEKGSILGYGQATKKNDSTKKALGLFMLRVNGSLDVDFGNGGIQILELPNLAEIQPVKAIKIIENIYILSKVNSCQIEAKTDDCTGQDLLISKHDRKGKLVGSFGEAGYLRLDFSKFAGDSQNPDWKNDEPVDLAPLNGGGLAFLSSYFYTYESQPGQGLVVGKVLEDGKLDESFADGGLFLFNPKNYLELTEFSSQSLQPIGLKLLERGNLRVELNFDYLTYTSFSLDSQGELKNLKENTKFEILKLPSAELFPEKEVRFRAKKTKNGKILFVGVCDKLEENIWIKLCAVRYHNSKLDETFSPKTNNRLAINYSKDRSISGLESVNFLEDVISQQIIISLSLKNPSSSESENLVLKPSGELNPNFASNGIWKFSDDLVAKTFLGDQTILVEGDNYLYLLKKPLFIDPVIASVDPKEGSVSGGLEVIITGDNFIKNPENPTISNLKKLGGGLLEDSLIENKYSVKDPQGNTFIALNFKKNLKIGQFNLVSEDVAGDLAVLKLNPASEVEWATLVGGRDGLDSFKRLLVNDQSEIYIAFETESSLGYLEKDLVASQNSDLVLAKLAGDGSLGWYKRFSSQGQDSLGDLYLAGDKLYLAGNFQGDLKVDEATLTNLNPQSFLASLDSQTGKLAWFQALEAGTDSRSKKILVDKLGNIHLFGGTNGEIILPNQKLSNFGSKDVFHLVYSATDGKLLSGELFGGKGLDEFTDAVLDTAGNLYLSLNLSPQEIDENPTAVTKFIFKINPGGKTEWRIPGSGKLLLDSENSVYGYGDFTGDLIFGTKSLKSLGGTDSFLGKIDSSGNLVWANSWGGEGEQKLDSVFLNSVGEFYISGTFSLGVTFENKLLSSAGTEDGFLAKINSFGDFVWIKQVGGKFSDTNLEILSSQTDPNNFFLNFLGSSNISLGENKFEVGDNPSLLQFNFQDSDLQVFFGDKASPKMELISPTKLKVTVPPGVEGVVDLKVRGYDGSLAVAEKAFIYVTKVQINVQENSSTTNLFQSDKVGGSI